MIIHGGDLNTIENIYKIPKEEIIDFSGNISPFGISQNIKDTIIENINCISTYPDKDYKALKKSISSYCNCFPENIIVGNGATEIISLFIKVLSPKNAIIISPSYSEYERELKKNNCNINFISLKEENNFQLNIDDLIEKIKSHIDLVIICNPNNPTGTAIENAKLEIILKKCKFLMVDETYAEFALPEDNINASSLTKIYNNLMVIRGTSKFFGVPGIRLGYGICGNEDILSQINNKKDPWSVNSFANIIGIEMFKDTDYIRCIRSLVVSERNRIIESLSPLKNLKVYDSKSNFILCKILNNKTNSKKLFEYLIKERILIRDVQNFTFLDDSFFRFCILSERNNNKLIKILKNILN